jgi:hypothetical protein
MNLDGLPLLFQRSLTIQRTRTIQRSRTRACGSLLTRRNH